MYDYQEEKRRVENERYDESHLADEDHAQVQEFLSGGYKAVAVEHANEELEKDIEINQDIDSCRRFTENRTKADNMFGVKFIECPFCNIVGEHSCKARI